MEVQEGLDAETYERVAREAVLPYARNLAVIPATVRDCEDGNLPVEDIVLQSPVCFCKAEAWKRFSVITVRRRMSSFTRPWMLELRDDLDGSEAGCRFLLKPEDLGWEACAMEVLRKLNAHWKQHDIKVRGHYVYAKEYLILPITPDNGLVEWIPSHDLATLKRKLSWLQDGYLHRVAKYLGEDEAKLDRLAASTSGFLAVSYLLGIRDGHEGNVLINKAGEMFRVDFGFLFGTAPAGIDGPVVWLPKTVIAALGGPSPCRFDDVIAAAKQAIKSVLHARDPANLCGVAVFDDCFKDRAAGAKAYFDSLRYEDFEACVDSISGYQWQKEVKGILHFLGYGIGRGGPAIQSCVNIFSPTAILRLRDNTSTSHANAYAIIEDARSSERIEELPQTEDLHNLFERRFGTSIRTKQVMEAGAGVAFGFNGGEAQLGSVANHALVSLERVADKADFELASATDAAQDAAHQAANAASKVLDDQSTLLNANAGVSSASDALTDAASSEHMWYYVQWIAPEHYKKAVEETGEASLKLAAAKDVEEKAANQLVVDQDTQAHANALLVHAEDHLSSAEKAAKHFHAALDKANAEAFCLHGLEYLSWALCPCLFLYKVNREVQLWREERIDGFKLCENIVAILASMGCSKLVGFQAVHLLIAGGTTALLPLAIVAVLSGIIGSLVGDRLAHWVAEMLGGSPCDRLIRDAYILLGLKLESNPSLSIVRQRYRQLALRHHPDKGGSHSEFIKINMAYELIVANHPERGQPNQGQSDPLPDNSALANSSGANQSDPLPDNSAPPRCFLPGTDLVMADGTKKDAFEIQVNETLRGFNGEEAKVILRELHPLQLRAVVEITTRKGQHKFTADHRVAVASNPDSLFESLEAGLLERGRLIFIGAEPTPITNVKQFSMRTTSVELHLHPDTPVESHMRSTYGGMFTFGGEGLPRSPRASEGI